MERVTCTAEKIMMLPNSRLRSCCASGKAARFGAATTAGVVASSALSDGAASVSESVVVRDASRSVRHSHHAHTRRLKAMAAMAA